MGRRKIQIAPIQDDRNRNVTFGKRRNGLFKKAYELGVLCQVDVAVLVWGHTGKLHIFSSQDAVSDVMDRYATQGPDDIEVTGPTSFGEDGALLPRTQGAGPSSLAGKSGKLGSSAGSHKRRRGSDDDSEDDEEDDLDDSQQPEPAASAMQTDTPGSASKRSAAQASASLAERRLSQTASSAPRPPVPLDLPQAPPHLSNLFPSPSLSSPSSSVLSNSGIPTPAGPGAPAPLFSAGYPYPSYPGSMASLSSSLGNALGFYNPQQIAAVQAAHLAQYGYLPPVTVRPQGGGAPAPAPTVPDMPQTSPYMGGHERPNTAGSASDHSMSASPQFQTTPLQPASQSPQLQSQAEETKPFAQHILPLSAEPSAPSPASQLFPEIYRSMTQFANTQLATSDTPDEDDAASRTFTWPSLRSSASTATSAPSSTGSPVGATGTSKSNGDDAAASAQRQQAARTPHPLASGETVPSAGERRSSIKSLSDYDITSPRRPVDPGEAGLMTLTPPLMGKAKLELDPATAIMDNLDLMLMAGYEAGTGGRDTLFLSNPDL